MNDEQAKKFCECMFKTCDRKDKLKKIDNKSLLWLFRHIKARNSVPIFSLDDDIIEEIEARLYPEYAQMEGEEDDKIKFTDKGWNVDGQDIDYLENLKLNDPFAITPKEFDEIVINMIVEIEIEKIDKMTKEEIKEYLINNCGYTEEKLHNTVQNVLKNCQAGCRPPESSEKIAHPAKKGA